MTGPLSMCGVSHRIWRERVGIEPTYAATNCNYWF